MSIKFNFLITGMIITCTVAAQAKPFTIDGSIKGKSDGYVYLAYKGNAYDSARIQNGKFSFNGELNGPVQAMVMMERNARYFDKYVQLFLVPGKMQLSLDYNNFSDKFELKGSSVQAEADELEKAKASVMAEIKPLSEEYNRVNKIYSDAIRAKKDEATLEKLKADATRAKDVMDPYYDQIRKINEAFMDKHPASFVTASMLRYMIGRMKLQEGEARYNQLSDEVKNTALGRSIKEELDGLRMGSPGAQAYVFASKELRGAPVSLADFKGKYVLVDFWASWCVPCRKGNPHLLSLYSKYKDKGFEIIGVSDDDGNPEAWNKAVEKDGIGVWKHVLRGLDMEKRMKGEPNPSDISNYYGIHSLPTKILIDPDGMIIGRYGGGGENDEAMDKKLAEIFSAK